MKIFAVAKKSINFAVAIFANRGVAQLAARHVRDVEVGSSSLLTPTTNNKNNRLWSRRPQAIVFSTSPSGAMPG